MVRVVKIIVDSKCTGCETCVNNCPAGVYELEDGKSVPVRVEECILCRTCESNCPEGAIQAPLQQPPTVSSVGVLRDQGYHVHVIAVVDNGQN